MSTGPAPRQLTADTLAAMHERRRALAENGTAPAVTADLDALLVEVGRLGNEVTVARKDAEQAIRERDAYQRAKAENDERFLTERDAARSEVERLRALLDAVRVAANAWDRSDEEIEAQLVDVGGVARVEQWIKFAAGREYAQTLKVILDDE